MLADDDYSIYCYSTSLRLVAACVTSQRETLRNCIVYSDSVLLRQCAPDIIFRVLVEVKRHQLYAWGEEAFVEWKAF